MGGGVTYYRRALKYLPRLILKLIHISNTWRKNQKAYSQVIAIFPHLRYKNLEDLPDFKKALSYKFSLEFMFGKALLKAHKNMLKFGYFKLFNEFKKLRQKYEQICTLRAKFGDDLLSNELFELIFKYEIKNLYEFSIVAKAMSAANLSFKTLSKPSFEFIKTHLSLIATWLNSANFKDEFIKTKHPYPPLLNPKMLNDETALLNYSKISAEIAWELNLPLPKNYKFILISGHGCGVAAIARFFDLGCDTSFDFSWLYPNIFKRYVTQYNALKIKGSKDIAINITEYENALLKKYIALLESNTPVIYLTRDPISLLKHDVGRDWNHSKEHSNIKKTFSLKDSYEKYLNFLTHTRPDIKANLKLNKLKHMTYTYALLENFSNISYIDMSEIMPQSAFNTIHKLALKFKLKVPENNELFSIIEFKGYMRYLFPLTLIANKKDILKSSKENKKITIIFDRPKAYKDKINLIKSITNDEIKMHMGVYINQNDYDILKNDSKFYEHLMNYLKEFVHKISQSTEQSEKELLTENQLLDFLKNEDYIRIELKKILDSELKHIKTHRPDIVASWKYYNEFEKICEELDKMKV